MKYIPEQPTPPERHERVVTAEGWVPPFRANTYTIELAGTFRTKDGRDLKIGKAMVITNNVLYDAAFEAAEYVRTLMGCQLAETVRQETGQLWSVGEPVRYQLRDDRDPVHPKLIDLPWTWERGEA